MVCQGLSAPGGPKLMPFRNRQFIDVIEDPREPDVGGRARKDEHVKGSRCGWPERGARLLASSRTKLRL